MFDKKLLLNHISNRQKTIEEMFIFQNELSTLAKRHSNVLYGLNAIDSHLRGIEMYKASKGDTSLEQAAAVFGLDPNKKYSNKPKDHYKSPIPTHFFTTKDGGKIGVSDVVHIDRIHDMRQKALDSLDRIQGKMSLIDPSIRDHTSHRETAEHVSTFTEREGRSHPVHAFGDIGSRMFGSTTANPLNRFANRAGEKSHMLLRQLVNRGGNQHTLPGLHHPDIAAALGIKQSEHSIEESKHTGN
jgi:hypothetical protein